MSEATPVWPPESNRTPSAGTNGGKEQRDVGDRARLRDAAERNAGLELLADGVGEIGRLQRRVDDAGMDHVAADLVPRELNRERLGERDQRALGGGVRVLRARE